MAVAQDNRTTGQPDNQTEQKNENEMKQKNFLDLTSGFAIYVAPWTRSKDPGVINALRGRPKNHSWDTWPTDLNSYLMLEKLHESIQKDQELDPEIFGDDWLILLPKPFAEWMATNTFHSIVDQWVTFFAMTQFRNHQILSTWKLHEGPGFSFDTVFNQSPKFLHEQIKDRSDLFISRFNESNEEDCEEWENQNAKDLPPWLDVRKEGTVANVCRLHFLHTFCYYAKDGDIKEFNRRGRFSAYSEWDEDAFTFWRHTVGRSCWPKPPGEVAEQSGFVYLLSDGEFFKIGYSKNEPTIRQKGCQTGNARQLKLVASIPGSIGLERSIHRTFASKRVRGEWFDLSQSDIRKVWG